jgi:hypothetical protein
VEAASPLTWTRIERLAREFVVVADDGRGQGREAVRDRRRTAGAACTRPFSGCAVERTRETLRGIAAHDRVLRRLELRHMWATDRADR